MLQSPVLARVLASLRDISFMTRIIDVSPVGGDKVFFMNINNSGFHGDRNNRVTHLSVLKNVSSLRAVEEGT